jgi:hypothetical protein
MGEAPPMETEPTFTVRECRRVLMPGIIPGASKRGRATPPRFTEAWPRVLQAIAIARR